MIRDILTLLAALLVAGGAFFTLTAAIGINRLPDLFSRMHAASKAGTVGSCLLLLAAGLHAGELTTLLRAVAGIVFFVLTAPVSAHILAKAAYAAGYRPSTLSVRDDRRQKPR